MSDIGTIIEKLKAIDTDVVIEDAMKNSEEELTSVNKKQLYQGFNREQGRLKEYHFAVYAEVKHRMNPIPGEGNPDLYATGSFYKGLYAKVNGNEVQIDSTDPKNDELQQKYGEDIMGLGGIFKEEFIDQTLRPNFNKLIEEKTGLTF